MDQLIFFAIIIFLSILESIARSRKAKRQQSGELPEPSEPVQFEWAQTTPGEAVPSYDDEPSHDDIVDTEPITTAEADARPRGSAELPSAEEIWAEIAGLPTARRTEPTTRRPMLDYAPHRPLPVERKPAPVARPAQQSTYAAVARRPLPERIEEPHAVHLAHVGYGTDPSERALSEQDILYAHVDRLGADAAAARRMLLSGGASLRQAVILHEVLGPPASLRTESEPRPSALGPLHLAARHLP